MKKDKNLWTLTIIAIVCCLISCAGNLESRKRQSKATRVVGEVYLSQGKYTAALREFIKAEKIYSKDHLLHNNFGIVYRKKGEIDKAIFHFKKAIGLKPDYISAKRNLAIALDSMKPNNHE